MSSRATFSLVFYINRTKQKKNGECPVMLRININGAKVALQIKRFINPKDWDSVRYCMKGRNAEARVFNEYIDAVKLRTHQKYNELIALHDHVSPHLLRDAVLCINTAKARMLIEIWEDHVETLRKLIGKENSRTTYLKYDLAKRHMVAFLKRNYKAADVSVKSVNHFMITQFSLFMKTELKLSHNTSTKFLHNLKKITTIALHHGWILRDPFKGFNLKLNEVSRPYLTNNELQRLMLYNSPFDRINRVRDFFVFSCFTGLAYADVKKLKGNEIEQNGGIYWIRTKRQKTGGRANIPLLSTPIAIIKKYCNMPELGPEDPVIPILSNQKINAYLKELADLCGIAKPLSYHVARHTFATTVTMLNGVPIETVSKMLGHKNITSTQHYARIVDQKVGEDMEILSHKIESRLILAS